MNDALDIASLTRFANEKGRIGACIGFSGTYYFDNGTSTEKRAAVAEVLSEFMRTFHTRINHVKTGPDRFVRLDQARDPVTFLKSESSLDGWEFYLHGGAHKEDANDLMIMGLGMDQSLPTLSFLKWSVPLAYEPAHGLKPLSRMLAGCKLLQPTQAYAGLCIIESPRSSLASAFHDRIYGLAQRFPGLDVDYPTLHCSALRLGIKSVSWLTALSTPYLEKLGGVQELRQKLPPAIAIHDYPGGAVFQAGPVPQIGDVNRKIHIHHLGELARALAPIRITQHGRFQYIDDGFDFPKTMAWLARFDNLVTPYE